MIIDNKGKLFGKISIIDILVVLCIFSFVLGVYYKFFHVKEIKAVNSLDTIEYKIDIKDIRKASVDSLKKGVEVYEKRTDRYLGKVVEKKVVPMEAYIEKTDGTIVKAEKPDRYEMIITLVTSGVEREDSFLANGNKEINVGSEINIKTRLVSFVGVISDVKKINK
ncbi:DUF4330 domain-containing protein [Tepidibacter thalassicus]|uniref:DUF4330 domain-containing protein n=1 Tax=Tepidibacter thalassicus DSM 15285 TaxID=1123350 RepID=A0A1M5TCM5_9FIRM|nr:DUF4330 domain-containing protein [Tepidibacter thalassicus]SHH48555.1 protein of unknown function [Tepidibacter thalassicus DSM 15285]